MVSIYRNAYLTISASRARDSSQGFFGESNAREYVEFEYATGDLRGQVLAFALPLNEEVNSIETIKLQKEPLSDRGWTLQERAAASRTVIYALPQLFFECNEGFRGEDGRYVKYRFESITKLEQKTREMRRNGQINQTTQWGRVSKGRYTLLESWQRLVGFYGQRRLAYASDKLPAISGLASVFAKWLDDECIAGLWRSQLIEGLLWQGCPGKQAQQYRAPSWSWASTDGNTDAYIPRNSWSSYELLSNVLDVNVKLKGTNPYGEVTDASLKIQAPIECLNFTIENWDPTKKEKFSITHPIVTTDSGNPVGTECYFDFDYRAEHNPHEALRTVKSLKGVDIFALILLKATYIDKSVYYHALIISEVKEGGDYQRLGTIYLNEGVLGKRPENQAVDEFPITRLV
ncbi:hypothetical protein FLONG3_4683 [Fusarium longipes]|uniref:Heterokaryon incompatibility domain-containing protein n=1 Tax=Fusarium longipes TaxID=694270 RepID=A0A395SXG6_9HYPO|nr:hypothetical protein FLONG3_4683 [Fusarium longipes]